MDNVYEELIEKLKLSGIKFDEGLNDIEISEIEKIYGIIFPNELKLFYKKALPVSKGFYDWKDRSDSNVNYIKRVISLPVDSAIEDVEEIEWSENWGKKPNDVVEIKEAVQRMALDAPKLIPIYSHRYTPSGYGDDAPVLSIHGTDIIYYAENIYEYFCVEFKIKDYKVLKNNEAKYVPFWSDLM